MTIFHFNHEEELKDFFDFASQPTDAAEMLDEYINYKDMLNSGYTFGVNEPSISKQTFSKRYDVLSIKAIVTVSGNRINVAEKLKSSSDNRLYFLDPSNNVIEINMDNKRETMSVYYNGTGEHIRYFSSVSEYCPENLLPEADEEEPVRPVKRIKTAEEKLGW